MPALSKRLPLGIPGFFIIGLANTAVVLLTHSNVDEGHRWSASPYSIFMISGLIGWLMGYGLSLLVQEFVAMKRWEGRD